MSIISEEWATQDDPIYQGGASFFVPHRRQKNDETESKQQENEHVEQDSHETLESPIKAEDN